MGLWYGVSFRKLPYFNQNPLMVSIGSGLDGMWGAHFDYLDESVQHSPVFKASKNVSPCVVLILLKKGNISFV